jgi:hypothetical protein
MRPRVGHGWTSLLKKNGRTVHLILNYAGRWITTGEAKGWPRCKRCRRPFEASPFNSGLCTTCYFYKTGLSVKDFWRLHKEGYPLAPYNIGEKSSNGLRILAAEKGNWRSALARQ